MKRLNLSIGQRLGIGFGTAGVLLVALVALCFSWLGRIAELRQLQATVISPRAVAAGNFESAVLYMGLATRTYAMTGEPGHLQRYEQSVRDTHAALERLAALPEDPDGVAMFARFPGLLDHHEAVSRTLVEEARGRADVAKLQSIETELTASREQLLNVVRDFAGLQQRKVIEARKGIAATQEKMEDALTGLGALVLVLLALTAWLTARGVRTPALALVSAARRLATGDFEPAIALAKGAESARPDLRDELAELSNSFGRMGLDLRTREARLQANARLAAALAASFEASRLCREALAELVAHLGIEVGAIYLAREDGRLVRRAALGLSGDEELAPGEGIPGRAVQSARAVVVRDLPADSPFTVRLGVDKLPPRAVAAVPMLVQGGQVAGVVLLATLRELSGEALAFVESSARLLGVSVQNALGHARLEELFRELQQKNETLQAQHEEIQSQNEELQSQQEEIHAQNEELQSQQEEIQAQNEELQSQNEELEAQSQKLRRAFEALTDSEERYHLLFTHLTEAFAVHELVYDAAGDATDYRFLAVNPAFEASTGLRAEQCVGRTVREVIPGIESSWIERYAKVAQTGQPAKFEDHAAALGKHFEVIAFRVQRDQFATVFMDVTERKRAEEALRDADRRRTEFLAVLSHELRNPLAPVRNSLYVLDRAQPGSPQAKRAQEIISRQVDHLSRLVDDLLDVTRIDRGKIRLQRSVVELGQLLREAAEDNQSVLETRGIQFKLEVPARPLYVDGDPARLLQVIGNLLQNAAKFTPTGGRVELALESGPDHRAVIRVKDTGSGIEPAVLPRLFQPFSQADDSLARTSGGLGLGLSLVKGLVELHGGTVRAASGGPGKGAEFTVELPLNGEPLPAAAPAPAPAHRARRVLVIDDNPDVADSMREVLDLNGHLVEVAYSGREGIEKARAWKPDVLLCDIGLPDMDGYDVARAFRGDEALKGVFLVALTGYALPEDLKRAIDAGFQEHMSKPPSIERVEEVLARSPGGVPAA